MDVTLLKGREGSLYGVVSESVVGVGYVVIKQYTDPLVKPISELWQIGGTPKLTFALNVYSECSLAIQWTNDEVNFYGLNPILLTAGPNDLTGLYIPGLQVKFIIALGSVAAFTAQGFIQMEAV